MGGRRRIGRTCRREYLGTTTVGLATLAGCLDDGGSLGRGSGDDGTPTDGTPADGSPTAALPTVDRSLPEAYTTGELDDANLSGGPGPDGIPSIDDPQFAPADEPPTNLEDGDPVFGVELNGEAKAYPQYALVWHEIVNDVVGGESVAVTYCPLTGTAQGFSRGDDEFGVSGRLINSNLVMFDRGSESWWPQILAWGIRGPHEGAYLEEFRVIWTTWGRWRDRYPETVVLTEDTGHVRDYGTDPYGEYNPRGGYYENENTLFSPLTTDDRFGPKDVVIGSRSADGAMAVPKNRLRERGVVEGDVGDVPYVTLYDEALDTGYVYRNPDGASVEYAGRTLAVDGEAYDSDHDSTDTGIDGYDPVDLPLERELGFDAMWFAWYGYYPSTVVHE